MSKEILKLKPEAIKPGLHVMVDWYLHMGGEGPFFPGIVVRKLRKNWLVKLDRGMGYQNASVPYEAMTINLGFTKEGRPLMDNKEDKKIMWSKEHTDYMKSLVIMPADKTIKRLEVSA